MKDYIKIHPWHIVEEGYTAEYNKVSESLFSLGNGRMGQRGNFEEAFSGPSLQGSYIAGVYYPDKTRVGWWKNGYPEYFAKVLNSVNWNSLHIAIHGEALDLNAIEVLQFQRVLDMKEGTLKRNYEVRMRNGVTVTASTERFCSMQRKDLGVIAYQLTADADIELDIDSFLNGDVRNQDSNYDEFFWEHTETGFDEGNGQAWLSQQTRKTGFKVYAGCRTEVQGGTQQQTEHYNTALVSGTRQQVILKKGETLNIQKFAVILSDMYHPAVDFKQEATLQLDRATAAGFDVLKQEHAQAWEKIWENCDIQIEGDVSAQQAIRFNIFQLYQTYTGEDSRLNIGPKGFTGEKYGGSTYWDTEAYCIPFYLGTAAQEVSKNLLIYRHNQLQKAIENAAKLGIGNGAALYPMVTMNGEECHNEWEITFEEIHRNGAIAYAIYDYIRYTGDTDYLLSHGLEVLIGIARYWAGRVNFSQAKQHYVILGVTGPNEFENNVNNNWYTNKIAAWCLAYAANEARNMSQTQESHFQRIQQKAGLKVEELEHWKQISSNMYYPHDSERNVYLQQDGFLDKDLIPVSELPAAERPIVEHWSWDKILRSCYIKQADVLQGFYFFEDEFDIETHKRHFDFYEPLTVHESSLSPCIHIILANKIGNYDKAYEFYLRTSRLDLNDINNDTCDGCHITSMAGTWMTISKGFAGMRVHDNMLHFSPALPKAWSTLGFNLRFRDNMLRISISPQHIEIHNQSGPEIRIEIQGKTIQIPSNDKGIAPIGAA